MRSLKFLVALLLAIGLPFGCGGETQSGAPNLMVDAPWARATPLVGEEGEGRTHSAVYLILRNTGAVSDTLLAAETPVSASAELHESRMESGVMRMGRVGALEIPSGGQVALSPGGYHLMLLDLNRPLDVGDTLTLFLEFEHSGRMEVLVPVRPMGSTIGGM